jgi:hypothetical protein
MTAAMVSAPNDGAGSFSAANARMAEDLEVPRPLRLILTLSIQRKAIFPPLRLLHLGLINEYERAA